MKEKKELKSPLSKDIGKTTKIIKMNKKALRSKLIFKDFGINNIIAITTNIGNILIFEKVKYEKGILNNIK